MEIKQLIQRQKIERMMKVSDDPAAEVLRREDAARLLRAMEALTPAQRELVLKVYFEGRSYASIAREEKVDESAIRDRIRRIHKKMKNFLE